MKTIKKNTFTLRSALSSGANSDRSWKRALHQSLAKTLAALLVLLGINTASATVFIGSPGNVVTMTESIPGTYVFTDEYRWRDEPPAPPANPETLLGTWANSTVSYDAEQWDGIGNVIMLEVPGRFIEYEFIIPVDASFLTSLSITTVMRGAGVRSFAYNYDTDSWPEGSFYLTIGGSGFDEDTADIDSSRWNTAVPGQVGFRILIEQISTGAGAGIDSLNLTAVTVPEPGTFTLLAVGAAALLVRRRRSC